MVKNSRTKSDAERIRTSGINGSEVKVSFAGYCSDAELIRTHGINSPKSARTLHAGRRTVAERIRTDVTV